MVKPRLLPMRRTTTDVIRNVRFYTMAYQGFVAGVGYNGWLRKGTNLTSGETASPAPGVFARPRSRVGPFGLPHQLPLASKRFCPLLNATTLPLNLEAETLPGVAGPTTIPMLR